MRTLTSFALLAGAASLAVLAGCTVKDVDTPALAGPSTLARQITLVADRDTLTQNGTDFTDIRITALGPDGQSENIPLRAQIFVNGVPNDFGTLSTKFPISPTTIRYTAPAASAIEAAPGTTVQIGVTPFNNGDFTGEQTRFITVRLQPQGIIRPTNPNLVAAFTFTPAAPLVAQPVTFDASTSTNAGTACAQLCFYNWNFGDGSTASGVIATHAFTKSGNSTVTLTVTDAFGATAQTAKVVVVAPPVPPTVPLFTVSPTPPPTNVEIFFNATAARPAAGRTIVRYAWEFGDGTGASGPIVTHKYTGAGTYVVVLTVTDDAGAETQVTQSINVGTTAAEPTATFTPTIAGRTVTVNASASKASTGSSIVNYKFDYGDGNFENVPNPVQSHTYTGPGTFIILLEVTDSSGKKASFTQSVTIP